MNMKRILAVSKRVFMDLKNDKRSLALIIIAPLFAMTIFGLAFSGELKDVNVILASLQRLKPNAIPAYPYRAKSSPTVPGPAV